MTAQLPVAGDDPPALGLVSVDRAQQRGAAGAEQAGDADYLATADGDETSRRGPAQRFSTASAAWPPRGSGISGKTAPSGLPTMYSISLSSVTSRP